MNDTTTLERTIDRYFDTWNEGDGATRAALAAEIWAPDGRYVDPFLDATGPAAISDGIGGLQAQFPGHRVERTTAIDAHHDRARFGWHITSPDGGVMLAGIDVAVLAADGRLQSISGFLGDVDAAA
jgi:hypothetical protein